MKIAIACGGTGGHLFPGLAVAEELRHRGHDTLLLVSPKQIDALALEGAKEQQSHALPGIGWPGFLSPRVFKFALTLLSSWRECGQVYRDFQPVDKGRLRHCGLPTQLRHQLFPLSRECL